MLINFSTVMKPSHHGQASIYLPICLMPVGSGEQEGTFGGLFFMKGQQNPHSFAQDVLHMPQLTDNQHPR